MPRPKSFDPPVALNSAMRVFWTKGFHAASIQNLTDEMGINRFSLYSTFGDKRELFHKALDMYRDTVVEEYLAPLEKPKQGLKAIENHLYHMIDSVFEGTKKGGVTCLLQRGGAEKGATDKAVAERVNAFRQRLFEVFSQDLKNAKASGELASDVKIPDAAWEIVALHMGLTAMEPAAPDKKALRSMVRSAMSRLKK